MTFESEYSTLLQATVSQYVCLCFPLNHTTHHHPIREREGRERERETDRQTDRQTDSQTERTRTRKLYFTRIVV